MDIERLRAQFPVLDRQINGRPIVYLDNACMTLRPAAVIDAVSSYYRHFPGCSGVGRADHRFGREVGEAVYHAREAVRRFINARPCEDDEAQFTPTREIVFTRNTTEAINLVARGYPFGPGAAVLTTDREHNSNLCPWQDLAAEGLIRHLWVPSREDGCFDLDACERILARENVELVSMVHVSNLDGWLLPAEELIEIAHAHGARVMLDAAQSAPHLSIDVQALDVDLLAFSAHKLCGPSGMGVLYAKEEMLREGGIRPLLSGGDTVEETALGRPPRYLDAPFRFEAGLQDYAGIIGTGAALEFLEAIGLDAVRRHVDGLAECLWEQIEPLREEFDLLGSEEISSRSGIITLCLRRRGVPSLWDQELSGAGPILSHRHNVLVRSGEFCVHSWFDRSGIGREQEKLRASLYLYNTEEECAAFAEALESLFGLDEYQMLPKL